jgi:hypothetical protein
VATAAEVTPEEFFHGHADALAAYERVRAMLDRLGPFSVRITKSQVAFRRKRGFAYLWRPGQYLTAPNAEVVLTVALGRHDGSPRFKEVVHPSPTQWMHHLEIQGLDDLDDEVEQWLSEAAARAD